jgi:plastocyanin
VLFLGSGALPCHWSGAPKLAAAQTQPVHEVRVRLDEWTLLPARISVPVGRTIRLMAANAGALAHALAVEGDGTYAESEVLGSGQVGTLELTFTTPGTYDLYCPLNAGQHRALGQEGVLVVQPATGGLLLPRTGEDSADTPERVEGDAA